MPKRLIFFVFFFLFIIFSYFIYYQTTNSSTEIIDFAMDTPLRVKVEGPNSAAYAKMAVAEIKRLDKLFNRFDPNSEVSRLNCGEKFKPSKEIIAVLSLAERMRQVSFGAFNVRYNGKIDLGGIGKGYAVELARRLLVKKGAKGGIIDTHSSIAVWGPRVWKIGIQDPEDKSKLFTVVELQNGQALSTSGNYERGKHIIDPRTHKAAAECKSVTLIGWDAGELDALSTAVFVLGPIKGKKLIKNMSEIKVIII
ncbi:MAG: FAD:protein FMN transferase [Candidatus Margulisiibacteriota bacterium]